jgi:hypothetical protein
VEKIKLNGVRLSNDEREVHLYFDLIEKTWVMDAFIPKFFRKAIKQGWTPIREYVYEDGSVCGMSLIAPERAISIRNVEKKKISEKQMTNLKSSDK